MDKDQPDKQAARPGEERGKDPLDPERVKKLLAVGDKLCDEQEKRVSRMYRIGEHELKFRMR